MKYFICLFFIANAQADDFVNFLHKHIEKSPSYHETYQYQEFVDNQYKSAATKLVIPSIDISQSHIKSDAYNASEETEYRRTSLSARYTIFNFGSDWANFHEKKWGKRRYKNSLRSQVISEEASLGKLLLDYIRQKEILRIQSQIIELKEKSFKISQRKYKRGIISKNDLLKIEINLTDARSRYLSLQQALTSIRSQLFAYNINDYTQSFPWINKFNSSTKENLLIKEYKEEQDATLLQYKYRLMERDFSYKSLRNSQFGSFSFQYSRDLYRFDDSDDLYGWSTAITYTLPLFENFSAATALSQRRAQRRVESVRYEYEKRKKQSELAANKANLLLSYENYLARMAIAKKAKDLNDSILTQYNKGKLSINELLIEEDRILNTLLLSIEATYQVHINYITYIHGHGKSLKN